MHYALSAQRTAWEPQLCKRMLGAGTGHDGVAFIKSKPNFRLGKHDSNHRHLNNRLPMASQTLFITPALQLLVLRNHLSCGNSLPLWSGDSHPPTCAEPQRVHVRVTICVVARFHIHVV